MPRPLTTVLPVVLAVALVAAVGTGCASVSPAVRVGDRTLSHAEVTDELGEWVGNAEAVPDPDLVRGPAPGSYSADFVANLVGFRIDLELTRAEADRRGLEVTPDLLDEARVRLYGDAATEARISAGWSEGYADRLLEDMAYGLALEAELGELEFMAWQGSATEVDRVEVSSRLGRWDDELRRVVPPEGPITPDAGLDPAGFPVGP